MHISSVSAVFLENDGKYLLMKRGADRRMFPNVWGAVGGGARDDELASPETTVLREIYEETGIERERIFDLRLRYVHIKRYSDCVVTHYIFFGRTDKHALGVTDEGTLHWIARDEVTEREYTAVIRAIVRHYFAVGEGADEVYLVGENGDVNTISSLG